MESETDWSETLDTVNYILSVSHTEYAYKSLHQLYVIQTCIVDADYTLTIIFTVFPMFSMYFVCLTLFGLQDMQIQLQLKKHENVHMYSTKTKRSY